VDEAPPLIDDAGQIADPRHRLKLDTLGFGNLPDRARMRATRIIPPCNPISAKLCPAAPHSEPFEHGQALLPATEQRGLAGGGQQEARWVEDQTTAWRG